MGSVQCVQKWVLGHIISLIEINVHMRGNQPITAVMNIPLQKPEQTDGAQHLANPATGQLELEAVLEALLLDGLIDEANSQLLRSLSSGGSTKGALERIAASGWNSAKDDEQKIDLDFLTKWCYLYRGQQRLCGIRYCGALLD